MHRACAVKAVLSHARVACRWRWWQRTCRVRAAALEPQVPADTILQISRHSLQVPRTCVLTRLLELVQRLQVHQRRVPILMAGGRPRMRLHPHPCIGKVQPVCLPRMRTRGTYDGRPAAMPALESCPPPWMLAHWQAGMVVVARLRCHDQPSPQAAVVHHPTRAVAGALDSSGQQLLTASTREAQTVCYSLSSIVTRSVDLGV